MAICYVYISMDVYPYTAWCSWEPNCMCICMYFSILFFIYYFYYLPPTKYFIHYKHLYFIRWCEIFWLSFCKCTRFDVHFCCLRVSCTWRGFGVWRKVRRLSSPSRSPPRAWSVWRWLGLEECTASAAKKDPKGKACSKNESQRETGEWVSE